MIRSTIRSAIRSGIRSTVRGGGSGAISRTFIDLDPVLQSYYELSTPFVATGDFEIEVEVYRPTLDAGLFSIISGAFNTSNSIRARVNGSTIQAFAYAGAALQPILSAPMQASALTTIKLIYSGGVASLLVNGVMADSDNWSLTGNENVSFIGASSGLDYFNGIIANPAFKDLSNPENNQSYRLGNATGNTETSTEGLNTLTYVNIPESNREEYTLTDDGTQWDNVSPEPQVLPPVIEVA